MLLEGSIVFITMIHFGE